MSLLLVHDFLFSKNGIAAPSAHPLRQAVERHKARLQSELTRLRLRRNCATIGDLKALYLRENPKARAAQPRWIRINSLKHDTQDRILELFEGYQESQDLALVQNASAGDKLMYLDPDVPSLVAVPLACKVTALPSYGEGRIILQDKASCFPAQLLLENSHARKLPTGDIIDACAAPGNKTSHLAALSFANRVSPDSTSHIFACERDPDRSKTLEMMMERTGASKFVTVLARQDFLALDPQDEKFCNVTHLLLDPSCSGSGMLSRDDVPSLVLPRKDASQTNTNNSGRKRKRDVKPKSVKNGVHEKPESTNEEVIASEDVDHERLIKLSNLQTHIIEHAFFFPAARRIVYSTCSIHETENENVVRRALSSSIAQRRGWSLLRREQQGPGLKTWPHRGRRTPPLVDDEKGLGGEESRSELSEQELNACIRCYPGTKEGTMGFFLAAFVRDGDGHEVECSVQQSADARSATDDGDGAVEDWDGFSDAE